MTLLELLKLKPQLFPLGGWNILVQEDTGETVPSYGRRICWSVKNIMSRTKLGEARLTLDTVFDRVSH